MRKRIHDIIFEADTPAGKAFDILLFFAIILSVIIVLLDSISSLHEEYGHLFNAVEWGLTILFTLEYFLRIYTVKNPGRYLFSFYGIIDFLAIVPTYLSLFLVGSHYLMVVRILRLLRVFRVLKLMRFVGAANTLKTAFASSRAKIIVFLEVIITIVVIIGSVMYLIEGPENGFTNIPVSIYWAIVTITTVGYGDIAPQTVAGQTLASLLMIVGYAIIAVPTGIITTEMVLKSRKRTNTQACENCNFSEHDDDALYCKKCGEKL
ncbi:MAG: ion transporter [Bacteroidales bacterium]|nr:ion transporter [Bacteroidales bacterium]MCF6341497.1 ion transporter [Bacteroidales bacterium]